MSQSGGITSRIEQHLRNHDSIVIVALVLLALIVGWINRFVQDDAFISFHYARNLVEGTGLTWFGARVEGYTNFLWVMWIALGLKVGIDPILWSYVGGLASFGLTVYALWRASGILFGTSIPALFAVLMFITNFSAASFATGGLETMLQTALWSLSLYILFEMEREKDVSKGSLATLSLLLAAAVLTRLDSVVPGFVIMVVCVAALVKRRFHLAHYLWFLLPFTATVGTWFAWKLSYYGSLLPNTYYSRLGSEFDINTNGFVYLFRFFNWYLIWPFLVMGVFAWLIRRECLNRKVLHLLLLVVIWCIYIVAVGGDFMEFRFMVPIMPPLFMLVSYVVHCSLGTRFAKFSLVASAAALLILTFASYRHARTFDGFTEDRALDSIPALSTFYGLYPDGGWDRVGKRLGEELHGTNAVVALDAVGAIPYYSRIGTVDQWGLNDRYVARYGERVLDKYRRPGHRRRAPLGYLRKRGVNLIVGHPTLIPARLMSDARAAAPLSMWVRGTINVDRESIEQIMCVAMPVDADMVLLMIYLVRDERLDALIDRAGWARRVIAL